jgi:hypothetical protein
MGERERDLPLCMFDSLCLDVIAWFLEGTGRAGRPTNGLDDLTGTSEDRTLSFAS